MTSLLWILVFGIPTVVLVGAIVWPERIPPDRMVDAIQQRLECEAGATPAAESVREGSAGRDRL
ncbi:hypothetical protein [Nocardia asteroides]|uniref:hypothetical protein n=1 Tax=Nocardia asteroides TaxID=1824 RepID=UPI00365BAE64